MQVDLWKKSGHFEFYAENMFDQMKVREVTSDIKSNDEVISQLCDSQTSAVVRMTLMSLEAAHRQNLFHFHFHVMLFRWRRRSTSCDR